MYEMCLYYFSYVMVLAVVVVVSPSVKQAPDERALPR